MKTTFCIALLFFLYGCQKRAVPSQTDTPSVTILNTPQILFVQMQVSKKEAVYEAKITSKTVVKGILDRDTRGIQMIENQWIVSFLDDKKKILEQITIPNPLDEQFEVADDKGQFKNVEVHKQEADFFFRVQSNPHFNTIEIEQILPLQQKKKLFSLNF